MNRQQVISIYCEQLNKCRRVKRNAIRHQARWHFMCSIKDNRALNFLKHRGKAKIGVNNTMINYGKIPREKLVQDWRSRLALECPEQSVANTDSIISWLLVSRLKQYERLNPKEQKIVQQVVEYRYQILRQRYLGISKELAYRNLITQLRSLVTSRSSVQIWIAKSHNHQRIMLDVLPKVIQELLQSNNYMQQQMTCIAKCTTDNSLKNALLFASLEEYCLKSIGNQQLFVYHLSNYLKRRQYSNLI